MEGFMTDTERAREIVDWFHNMNDSTSPKAMWDAEDALKNKIAQAFQAVREEGYQSGIKYKCQLIAECKEQWIEEAAKCADDHACKTCHDGCDYDEGDCCNPSCNLEIATAIRKLKEDK